MDLGPQFSPDGKKVAFYSNRSGAFELWTALADGSSFTQLTFQGVSPASSPRWSPDGKSLAFDSYASGNADIWVIRADGTGVRQLTRTPSEDIMPTWSADGRWIYYASFSETESGIWRIRTTGGNPERLTRSSGIRPLESPDGMWVYNCHGGSLFRLPAGRGLEVEVRGASPGADWRSYSLTNRGVYFLDRESRQIRLLDPNTGAVTKAVPLGWPPSVLQQGLGLTISPDDRWLLISVPDSTTSDLKLVENFRH
jgi:Tol biopolymer transport system component